MNNIADSRNRLALYVFWEKEGIVRDYVSYYLKGLQEVAKDVVLIANGGVNDEGLAKLQGMGVEVLQRENHGLDFAAWKAALLQRGWEKVQSYDELILCNCSCYGPVYPFSEAFERMSAKPCDFWGMTSHPDALQVQLIPDDPNTKIKEHLQSYFLVFRKRAIENDAFQAWWKDLKEADSFNEEVAYHEIQFTSYLSRAGLKWESYLNDKIYEKRVNPSMLFSDKLLIDERVPLIKRKLFADHWPFLFSHTTVHAPANLVDYVTKKTSYETDAIWEDLLATKKLSALKECLHLNYILSDDEGDKYTIESSVACICMTDNTFVEGEFCCYLQTLPENATIIIMSHDSDVLNSYKIRYEEGMFAKNRFETVLVEKDFGLLRYLITSGQELIKDFEYVCFISDPSDKTSKSRRELDELHHQCECLLHSPGYVKGILKLFADNKHIAILNAPPVCHGNGVQWGRERGESARLVNKLFEQFKLSIPKDEALLHSDGCFWARKDALECLWRENWTWGGYSKNMKVWEHGIALFIPYLMQQQYYCTATVSHASYAQYYMNTISTVLERYTNTVQNHFGKLSHNVLLNKLQRLFSTLSVDPKNSERSSVQSVSCNANKENIVMRESKEKRHILSLLKSRYELRKNKKYFFPQGYLFLYPDVKAAAVDPWMHYVRFGKDEKRGLGYPAVHQFNAEYYLNANPDVKASGMDPWRHYVLHGHAEGRQPLPPKKDSLSEYNNPSGGAESKRKCVVDKDISFSVIMPTYNRANTMGKSVDCILQQTYGGFELIIADDGSTDNTEEFINTRYAKEIQNGVIKYLKLPHRGVCPTRNAALAVARYPWIAYADSDNYPRPDFLETFAEAIRNHPERRCFYAQMWFMNTKRLLGREFSHERLCKANYIDMGIFVHHVCLYRACGGFDNKLARLVDWDLIIRYTEHNEPYYIKKIVLDYNDNGADNNRISVSANFAESFDFVQRKHRIKNVTTCITAYNHEKYLRNAIESALMQTGRINHKIVIFDDQSTDGTQKIGEEYAAKYPDKVRYVRNQTNLGMARNMKQCFRTIDTDFIAILEGDDYWIDEYRLHKMCTFLDTNPDCSMCFNATLIYGEKSLRFRGLKRQTILPEKLDGDDILNSHAQNPFANFSSCVYRKDVVQTLPDCLYEGIVTEMAVGLHAQRYGKVGFINEKMSVYRQHPGGLWSGKDPRRAMEYRIKARETMLEVAPDVYKKRIAEMIATFKSELEKIK